MNDLEAASRFIEEAAKQDKQSDFHMRILGYKALILLKGARRKKGFRLLTTICSPIRENTPLRASREVRAMWRTGRVDLAALQQLLDGEIGIYERDIEQFRRAGTGWFAMKYGATMATDGGNTYQ